MKQVSALRPITEKAPNLSDYAFDPLVWAEYPLWTLHDIAYLSAGVDPDQASGDQDYPISAEQEEQIRTNQRKLDRFKLQPDLRRGLEPRTTIGWLRKVGIDFLEELEAAVLENAPVPAASEKPGASSQSGATKKLRKVYEILLVVAISKFNFDPRKERGSVPREISDAAATLGISIDQGTIRSHLYDAWDSIGADKRVELERHFRDG